MTDKFKDIPVEADTKIIYSLLTNFGEIEVVYQKWYWEGIFAESLIFFNEDITHLNEEQIKEEVANSPLFKEDSSITYTKGEIYTFVNFNFNDEE